MAKDIYIGNAYEDEACISWRGSTLSCGINMCMGNVCGGNICDQKTESCIGKGCTMKSCSGKACYVLSSR